MAINTPKRYKRPSHLNRNKSLRKNYNPKNYDTANLAIRKFAYWCEEGPLNIKY